MYDLQGGDNVMIYDGHDNPKLLRFNKEKLTAGNSYAFTVSAFNFNGEGSVS
jgi:hypothetical protein